MGDAQKAIFFYKRYLSNSPKARNRSEVEQKIEALQKQLSVQEQAKGLPPPGPFGPDNPGRQRRAARDRAAACRGQSGGGGHGRGRRRPRRPRGRPARAGSSRRAPLGAAQPPPHRIDLRAAIGFDTWSSGLQENAQPSFAFTLAGGYTFGNPASRVRFRLGALFGYTFLKETDSKDNFTSFLIDPTIVVRVAPRMRADGRLRDRGAVDQRPHAELGAAGEPRRSTSTALAGAVADPHRRRRRVRPDEERFAVLLAGLSRAARRRRTSTATSGASSSWPASPIAPSRTERGCSARAVSDPGGRPRHPDAAAHRDDPQGADLRRRTTVHRPSARLAGGARRDRRRAVGRLPR